MKVRQILLINLGLFLLSSMSFSTIIHVPTDQLTIQAGIDAASEGDTVLVADGTYTGDGNRDIDFGGKNIYLKSENGPEVTIIDCESNGRGFNFHSGEDLLSVVDGFTITKGMSLFGAGIYISNSDPTVKNNRIIRNCDGENTWYYIYGGKGAGIYCVNNSSPVIDNNIINENYLSRESYGAALFCSNSTPVITNNVIKNNSQSCYSYCGGLYFSNCGVTLENNTISDNYSWYGSPVAFSSCEVSCVNNIIKHNFNLTYGGAISCDESNVSINGCIIFGNMTAYMGVICEAVNLPPGWRDDEGFSYIDWLKIYIDTMTVTEDLYYSNPQQEGAVFAKASDVNIFNSIICANTPPQVNFTENGTANINYCLVAGGYEGIGIIDDDPLFLDPKNGDFNVCAESPCIDAGDPTILDPNNSISDIGIYYSEHPVCNNGTIVHVTTTGSDELGDGSFANPFRTIQHGLDMAHSGDSVLVQKGIYTENLILNYKNIALSSYFILSDDSSDIFETVIQSTNEEAAIYLKLNSYSCSVTGFTITSSWIPNGVYSYGGVVCDHAIGLISHNLLTGNHFTGIRARLQSDLLIEANIITENGVGISMQQSIGNIKNNLITNHSSGGLAIEHSNPIIDGNFISNNNIGISEGVLAQSLIINNVIDKSVNYGIRVSSVSADPIIKGNTITQNRMGIIIMGHDYPVVENCIFAYNSSFGLDCPDPMPLNFVKKCNLFGNGNDSEACVQELIGVDGNFSVDPLFCDTANDNYYISDFSQCVPENNSCHELIGALDIGCYSEHTIWHVSVDGNDMSGDGSFENPFATIQHGIDIASEDDMVIVHDGTYTGEGNRDIDFGGKNIHLKSENGPEVTIIAIVRQSGEDYSRGFYFHNGENSDAVVEGFTITGGGGFMDYDSPSGIFGAAIRCENSSPTIKNNYFINNVDLGGLGAGCPTAGSGGALYFTNSSSKIRNNIFRDNGASSLGGAIYLLESNLEIINNTFYNNYLWGCSWGDNASGCAIYCGISNPVIKNNIFWTDIKNERSCEAPISIDDASIPLIECNDIKGGWNGGGNIDATPMFCNLDLYVYTISENSPCAPSNNDCEALIGALGIGCLNPLLCADLNCDGSVNTLDITYMVDYYFNGGSPPPESYNGDLNCDGVIGLTDLVYLSQHIWNGENLDCCE